MTIIRFREWMEQENRKEFLLGHQKLIEEVCHKIDTNIDDKLMQSIINDVWTDAKLSGIKTMDNDNIELSVKQSVSLLRYLKTRE